MIHLTSLLHTISLYANRWGGPRYRTEELAKFLNKHLYNIQEEQLMRGELVNLCLSYDAFLSSRHTPLYASCISTSKKTRAWRIKDELGFEAIFAEGTEILTFVDHPEYGPLEWLPVESCIPGTKRVINLELVPELKNDTLNHHNAFTDNFVSIKCEPEQVQQLLCDSLTAMMVLKERDCIVRRVDKFDSNNTQEIYLVDITEVEEIEPQHFFDIKFSDFSYSLKKNKQLSNKSKNRYYNYRHNTTTKRWLEKMRSKVFHIKKSNKDFALELKHDKNSD